MHKSNIKPWQNVSDYGELCFIAFSNAVSFKIFILVWFMWKSLKMLEKLKNNEKVEKSDNVKKTQKNL